MGKSTLATNIAENAAIDHGRVGRAVLARDVGDRARAPLHRLAGKGVERRAAKGPGTRSDRWPKVLNATEKLASAPIYLDDSSDIERARDAREGAPPARPGTGSDCSSSTTSSWCAQDTRSDRPRVEQVGQISRGLKILARELEDPGDRRLAAVARAVERHATRRCRCCPTSGRADSLEQDADVVMFVYREEYYLKGGIRAARGRRT